jgi:eukaryotic-like serine/threonine-protein kinase
MNIGDRVGDYEIVEVLGRGGMGQVYKIRNVLSERIEAMKVLLPNLDGAKELDDRFLREIKVQGTLDHPNIAKLYNALNVSNQLLMVMEFIEGTSLEEILKHGPLSVTDATNYGGQVLDALAYAHGRGVVHRDIKPGNIMRTPSGTMKVLDFGLARIMNTESALTQPGTTVGSLYYMSPEQIKGAEPDPRSDLYSFGVALYEMITGIRPFRGDTNYAVIAAHLKETPPAPNKAAAWVPAPLSDIIMRAIAKDPEERFQSAQEFCTALSNLGATASDQAVTTVLSTLPFSAPPMADTAAVPGVTAVALPEIQQSSAEPVAVPRPAATVQTQPLVEPAPPDQLAAGLGVPASLPPQKSSSLRWLYMSIGSVATLAVLAFAVIEVPKFLQTHANEIKKTGKSAPSAQASPTVQSATSGNAATAPQSEASSATQSSQSAGDTTDAAHAAEIRKLQQEQGLMTARARAAQTSLGSLKDQMASQGLGLRRDVVEAENRMNLHLSQAKQAIRAGDTEGARRHLAMAELALDTIEKFLGR